MHGPEGDTDGGVFDGTDTGIPLGAAVGLFTVVFIGILTGTLDGSTLGPELRTLDDTPVGLLGGSDLGSLLDLKISEGAGLVHSGAHGLMGIPVGTLDGSIYGVDDGFTLELIVRKP